MGSSEPRRAAPGFLFLGDLTARLMVVHVEDAPDGPGDTWAIHPESGTTSPVRITGIPRLVPIVG